ncbi:MAG: hypothetical protein JXQ96_22760 [Cyclobacteriaceae bacterium]
MQNQNLLVDSPDVIFGVSQEDELTVHVKSTYQHESAMSEDLKEKKRKDAPALADLFKDTLKNKGEYHLLKEDVDENNEIEIKGLSQMTLHSFILKAEELGKNVTYSKILKVKISD